LASRS